MLHETYNLILLFFPADDLFEHFPGDDDPSADQSDEEQHDAVLELILEGGSFKHDFGLDISVW